MESLPPEVLHMICSHLSPWDAAKARFASRDLSVVASYYLTERLRFHTSKESFARLEQFSEHPIFRQTIKLLIYEGNILADVGCIHSYAHHYDAEHHKKDKPQPPPNNCSQREQRLYQRNKNKFDKELSQKYSRYRALYESQQSILTAESLRELLGTSIAKFPNLQEIIFQPVRQCAHMLSGRFLKEFGIDCAVPMTTDPLHSKQQLLHMLLPGGQILNHLRSLDVTSISPSFFSSKLPKSTLVDAFRQLENVEFVFRLSSHDTYEDESASEAFNRHLSNGVLRKALAAASNLKTLAVGFESSAPCFIDASHIFGDSSWDRLHTLRIDSMSATQEAFIRLLRRQPRLANPKIAFVMLTEGSWPATLNLMHSDLVLDTFEARGFLEDPDDFWPMHLINLPAYLEDREELTLSRAVNDFVCSVQDLDEDDYAELNPLMNDFADFESPDVLSELHDDPDDFSEDEFAMDLMDLDDTTDGSITAMSVD